MDSVQTWKTDTIGESAAKALTQNGFAAVYVKTSAEAVSASAAFLKKGMSVGFGGSMTVKGLALQEHAAAAGCEVLDHNAAGLTAEQRIAILRRQLTSDVFICSANAVTLDGEIVNIDGNGNRVAALSFGPAKNIIIVGINKIVKTLDDAFVRIESFASPMNNKRLSKTNPCVTTSFCMDCSANSRICRIYHILKRCPASSDFTVIIVGETLGY